jgi:ion channel-forming bestrophin family protein
MSDTKPFYAEMSFLKFLLPGGRVMVLALLFAIIYTGFAIWWDDQLFPVKKLTEATSGLFSSAAMGILLVFRINSAYDRWWEGRKLWGQLVNDSRNLSIKINQLLAPEDHCRQRIAQLLMQYPGILRDHLRELLKVKAREDGSTLHNPLQTASAIYQNLIELKRDGRIDGFELLQLDPHARGLMDICGGCERIIRSPISGSFKLLIWAALVLYLILLPWMLVPVFDLWSPLLVFLSAYFVLAIELLAEDIERPFGLSPNDIPLDAICTNIRQSVQEIFEQ